MIRLKSTKIKWIIFDVGGVLFPDTIEPVYDSLNKKIGKKIFERESRPHREALLGRISEKERFEELSRKSGIHAKDLKKMFTSEFLRILKINKEVIRTRDALKKKGYKIGILSNMTERGKKINQKRFLFDGFNPVILSCDVKTKKPGRKIFHIFIKKADAKPEECIFIDDRKKNVSMAKKLGMKAIVFKNASQLKIDLRKLGIAL